MLQIHLHAAHIDALAAAGNEVLGLGNRLGLAVEVIPFALDIDGPRPRHAHA
jgi:hypothetical protein